MCFIPLEEQKSSNCWAIYSQVSSGPTYIELQTDYIIHNCIWWQRQISASFRGLGKSVFLHNRSRYFCGVCYNSTHDHSSPGKLIRFGSWIYPGFREQSHMETPRNWAFVIGWVYEVRIASSHGYSLRFSVYYEYIDGTTCKCRDECVQLIVYVLRCSENW